VIISYIKAPRFSWFGHVDQMTNKKTVKKLCDLKPISTGLTGRPIIRWKKDIKEDLRTVKINNLTKCTQERFKSQGVVEKTKTLIVVPDEEEGGGGGGGKAGEGGGEEGEEKEKNGRRRRRQRRRRRRRRRRKRRRRMRVRRRRRRRMRRRRKERRVRRRRRRKKGRRRRRRRRRRKRYIQFRIVLHAAGLTTWLLSSDCCTNV